MRRCSILLVAALLGCATRPSTGAAPAAARATPVGPPAPQVPGTVCGATPRDDDRCPVLDDPVGDRDGCPDATIAFDPGQAQGRDAQALLVELAAEIRRLPRLTKIQLREAAPASEGKGLMEARVRGVLDALEKLGVARRLFTTDFVVCPRCEAGGYLWFEPLECIDGPIGR
jgi:hypothetical protein